MVDVDETSAAILLIATLPQRSNIPELVIRPTMHRNMTGEIVELRQLRSPVVAQIRGKYKICKRPPVGRFDEVSINNSP